MRIKENRVKLFWLLLILPFYCFGMPLTKFPPKPTIYTIEQSISKINTLKIHVKLSDQHSATQLILRGVSMGISSQVKDMVCDGKAIKETKPGVWEIPRVCRYLQWEVPLLESGAVLASAQQSIKSGDFILISEASSLPRILNETEPEILKISLPNIKTFYPEPNSQGEITLPSIHSAPFFVLLNAMRFDSLSSEKMNLTYFVDHHKSVFALPSIASHMIGLQWLNTVIPTKNKKDFTIAWLGIPKERMSLAGAAGENILLTNYPNNGELTFGNVMLLYVALHEAFHQFALSYEGKQPTWMGESLASYYGARGTQVALPNDPKSPALMERFQKDSDRFSEGLLAINRKVERGDRSEYGAFYTKGVAFWAAVDKMLQARGDSLDQHLIDIFKTKYDTDGNPINLQEILTLTSEEWMFVRKQFLD